VTAEPAPLELDDREPTPLELAEGALACAQDDYALALKRRPRDVPAAKAELIAALRELARLLEAQ